MPFIIYKTPLQGPAGLLRSGGLKWQCHVAQIALGFNQNQRALLNDHRSGPFAWHMHWFGFCGNSGLNGCDTARIGINPLQPRALRYLFEFSAGQGVGCNLGHATGLHRRLRSSLHNRCNNSRCCNRYSGCGRWRWRC